MSCAGLVPLGGNAGLYAGECFSSARFCRWSSKKTLSLQQRGRRKERTRRGALSGYEPVRTVNKDRVQVNVEAILRRERLVAVRREIGSACLREGRGGRD